MYVPLLKGKEGELSALEELASDVRANVTPLIEVPRVPYDFVNERPSRSIDQHVGGLAERLNRAWSGGRAYLDLSVFSDEERMGDGRLPLDAVLGDCRENSLIVAPVLSLESTDDVLAVARSHINACGSGACIRLRVSDFEDDESDPNNQVDHVLESLQAAPQVVDLLLDLEALEGDSARNVLVARSVLQMLPRAGQWRSQILAASSFPSDLSDVDAATVRHLPRREWELWMSLQRRPKQLPTPFVFGDYAIAHPVPTELDPRTMRMSASIRYTANDSWLVVKGRNVRQYGFEQYFELCRTLVARPEYSGRAFSWGDRFIDDCAFERSGPGNATTWRKVGTNHHITLVARALAAR